jgi:hypothetical protein
MRLRSDTAGTAIGRIRGDAASLISESTRIGAGERGAAQASAIAINKLPNGNGRHGRARAIDV